MADRRTVAGFFPGIAMARTYRREWLGVDLLGGLTVGAMLIPQCMAYAALAGLPPQYGFHAVLLPLLLYAVLGTSRHLGVGPEPGTAILAATGVGVLAGGDPARYATLMSVLALVVGAIALLAGMLRLGFIASALSKPVLVGYITGVGLTLLSSQFAAFTKLPISGEHFFTRCWQLLRQLDQIHWPTAILGAAALLGVLLLRRYARAVPGALVAVVGASLAAWLLDLPSRGVLLIGEIPAGLPIPAWPSMSGADLVGLLPVAAGIALVGYTDNLLTARSLAARLGYRVDPDQELIALGANNVGAGLLQGFPVSSSASRTAVPASLGSKTQLVGVIAGAFVVITLLVAGPVLASIPRAALAAVIVSAAIAIIDLPGYRDLWRISRLECALGVATALAVITTDVLVGVLVAVGLSVLVALSRIARPHDAVLGDLPGLDGWVEADSYPDARTEEGLLVYRFDAPLFFGNADRFRERVTRLLQDNPGDEEWVLLDFEGVGDLDTTAIDMLTELVDELHESGVGTVAVARAHGLVRSRLRRSGLADRIALFPTINGAVSAYRHRTTTA